MKINCCNQTLDNVTLFDIQINDRVTVGKQVQELYNISCQRKANWFLDSVFQSIVQSNLITTQSSVLWESYK